MPQPWRAREVAIVLPIALAEAMWHRAAQFDIGEGGRFDARGAALLVWSNSDADPLAEPVSCVHVRWHDPDEHHATVWKLAWDEAAGGSEAERSRVSASVVALKAASTAPSRSGPSGASVDGTGSEHPRAQLSCPLTITATPPLRHIQRGCI